MSYYVYIIESEKDGTFYKGYTKNIDKRLIEHNNGQSRYTSKKMPWKLVYLEEFETKREALIRERKIKHYNSEYLLTMIKNYKENIG